MASWLKETWRLDRSTFGKGLPIEFRDEEAVHDLITKLDGSLIYITKDRRLLEDYI